MRMTKTAKAFLEHFVLSNPKTYEPDYKVKLAKEMGLTIEELGSICIKLSESYSLSVPPHYHMPPHEQRIMDIAGGLTLGIFMSREFQKFSNPEKEKKN